MVKLNNNEPCAAGRGFTCFVLNTHYVLYLCYFICALVSRVIVHHALTSSTYSTVQYELLQARATVSKDPDNNIIFNLRNDATKSM